MAALTPYRDPAVVAPPIAANVGGDSIPGDSRTIVLVQNPTGAAITLTVEGQQPDNFGVTDATAHDAPYVIAAGTYRRIGPFPSNRFNDAAQRVQFTYSAVGLNLWPLAE